MTLKIFKKFSKLSSEAFLNLKSFKFETQGIL